MALSYFIPTVWSETLYRELEKEYIGVKNCSRDYEGDVKNIGDTVKIIGLNPISVFDYSKNTDMETPEELSDNERSLVIERAKAFNFLLDDIDKVQATPKLMQEAMRQAASALSDEADKYIYSLHTDVSSDNTVKKAGLTSDGVIDFLLDVKRMMMEANVSGNEEIILEVPPAVAAKIVKAKIVSGTSNETELDKGCIGTFLGFRIYVSNNICTSSETDSDGGNGTFYKCFARTKRAIAFAEQINEVESYRPEKRFADGVKGLHLYGAKIIYPAELKLLNISLATEA